MKDRYVVLYKSSSVYHKLNNLNVIQMQNADGRWISAQLLHESVCLLLIHFTGGSHMCVIGTLKCKASKHRTKWMIEELKLTRGPNQAVIGMVEWWTTCSTVTYTDILISTTLMYNDFYCTMSWFFCKMVNLRAL